MERRRREGNSPPFYAAAFRRPVTDAELDRYLTLVTKRMEAGAEFQRKPAGRTGGGSLLAQFSLSPGRCSGGHASRHRIPQLASRLSYFFWSTMPDAELLDLAGKGSSFSDPKTLHAQVERMLIDPRTAAFVSDFTGQWLRLRQINDTTPDEKLYGKFDELLRVSMVWEGEGFFRQLIIDDLPIVNLLDSNWAMLNQRLAEHYGIEGVHGIELRKVTLPPGSVRGGVLTQAGVLKVTANGTTTSPVLRGVWVLENILGEPTPPPPPNVGGIEPDIRGARTVREQLDKHRHVESCSVCHRKIDPPGFALESFDPIGDYRENYLRWHATNAKRDGATSSRAQGRRQREARNRRGVRRHPRFKKLLVERQDISHTA